MEENPKPTRRWYRFSLRTMLVLVTVVCVCVHLWSAMNWKQQRHDFLRSSLVYNDPPSSAPVSAPLRLRILGEQGVAEIFSDMDDESEFVAASKLFPESRIYIAHITKAGVYYVAESVNTLDLLPYYQNGEVFREHLLFQPATQD